MAIVKGEEVKSLKVSKTFRENFEKRKEIMSSTST